MAHTSGPWSVWEDPETFSGDVEVVSGDLECPADLVNRIVCTVRECDPDDVLANAHLIAAAPDLLKACQGIAAWGNVRAILNDLEGFELSMDWARRAVAKAKGMKE
jgi:hypothetical protein